MTLETSAIRTILAVGMILLSMAGVKAQGLPLDVQIDLALTAFEQAIGADDHAQVLEQLARLRDLDPAFADGELLYFEAVAASETGNLARAETALTRFLSEVGRQSPSYSDALALWIELTPQFEARAEAERAAEAARVAEEERQANAQLVAAEQALNLSRHDIGHIRWILAQYEGRTSLPVSLPTLTGKDRTLLHAYLSDNGMAPSRYLTGESAEHFSALETHPQLAEQRRRDEEQEAQIAAEQALNLSADDIRHIRWILAQHAGQYRPPLNLSELTSEDRARLDMYLSGNGMGRSRYLAEDSARHFRSLSFEPERNVPGDPLVFTSGDWTVYSRNDACYIQTYATSFSPEREFFSHPYMSFFADRDGSGSTLAIFMIVPNPLRADSLVTANVDGQRFDLQVDNGWVKPRSTGNNTLSTEVTKAIRAGQSITIRGAGLAAEQPVSVTFSAAGFTRAFNDMAQRCNRPGILSWIQ